ncbi:hypothetical protein [Rhodoferax sp.]|nr:hypothetical protein [Rhodoferax sp.]MDO9198102.1 hypothetical protein [Rhodoferax sp.]
MLAHGLAKIGTPLFAQVTTLPGAASLALPGSGVDFFLLISRAAASDWQR